MTTEQYARYIFCVTSKMHDMQITIRLTPYQYALACLGAASIGQSLESAIASGALLTSPITPAR